MATSPDDVTGWPPPPSSIPPRVRGGAPAPPATGSYPGGYPAVGSPSGYPQQPPPGQGPHAQRPATGAFRPIQAPPPGGGYGPPPPATGAHRAVPPPGPSQAHGQTGRPTGGYPAARQSGFGPAPHPLPGTAPPGSQVGKLPGHFPPPPSSGALPAVPGRRPTSDLGRAQQSSGQGLVVPNLVGQVPPAPTSGSLKAVAQLPSDGDELDGYKILQTIGKGSMGRVYRARDQAGRNVALKVILGDQADAEGLARFEREGQAMAAVPRHKNVVNVHSTGTARGLPYLVCDLIDGTSLVEVLKRGPMAPAQAVAMGELLARAMEHVHKAGVLHRDLKPANILIRAEDGEPVLADFGMAGMRGAERLTRTGDLLGTPLYMPPEQVLGLHRQIDARSEVWALGAIIYEMLAGEPPFGGKSLVELSKAITQAAPAPLVHIDEALEEVLLRAMAKKREARWPSAGALADALAAWRRRPSAEQRAASPRRPRRLVPALVAGAVASVGLGAGAIVWKRTRKEAAVTPGEVTAVVSVAAAAPVRNPLLDTIVSGSTDTLRVVQRQFRDQKTRGGLADPAVTAALRGRILDASGVHPVNATALCEWLQAYGLVCEAYADAPLPPEPEGRSLADVVMAAAADLAVDLVPPPPHQEDAPAPAPRTREEEAARKARDELAAKRTGEVLTALAGLRARPRDRVAAEGLLDRLVGWFMANLLSASDATSALERPLGAVYTDIIYASVDLDLDIEGERLIDPRAGKSLAAEVVRVRVALASPATAEQKQGVAQEAIQLASDHKLGPVTRARLLSNFVSRTEEASVTLDRFQKARELDPDSAGVRMNLAQLYSHVGMHAEAAEEVRAGLVNRARRHAVRTTMMSFGGSDLEYTAAEIFIESRCWDEARALLDKLRDATDSNELPNFAKLRQRLEEGEKKERGPGPR